MRKVMQTKLGEKKGNCFDACIASILEIDIEKIPPNMMNGNWHVKYQNWFRTIGLQMINMRITNATLLPDVHYIVSGPSPRHRNCYHSVVGKNAQIVHDPHPDNEGLKGDDKYWEYTFLIPISYKSIIEPFDITKIRKVPD